MARFHQEAFVAASTNDEHICEVTDRGTTASGAPYLVMPLLSGHLLSQLLKQSEPCSVFQIVDIACPQIDGPSPTHSKKEKEHHQKGDQRSVRHHLLPERPIVPPGRGGVRCYTFHYPTGCTAAIASFSEFLERPTGDKKRHRKMRQIAIDEIETLQRLLGVLRIKKAPAGTDVRIDGVALAQMPLPTPLRIDPGQHVVELRLAGYAPWQSVIKIVSGQETVVTAALKRKNAHLAIECDPPVGAVTLDDRALGPCPQAVDLKPGKHTVRVEANGMVPHQREIETRAGQSHIALVELKPIAVPSNPKKPVGEKPTPAAIKSPEPRWLRVSGWSAVGLAAGSAALGGYYTSRLIDRGNEMDEIVDQSAEGVTPTEWVALNRQHTSLQNKAIRDYAGMTISFAAAGALALAGTIVLLLTQKKKNGEPS